MAALSYQFGRYLMIASSRPGTQPANLGRDLERQYEPALGFEIHDQYQYRDELLARESGNLSNAQNR